jgi:myo-inositol-1(or 4)-monophosphatase
LSKELEVAVAAAEAAGEVLRNGFGRHHRIEYKGEADLVTEADEEAERKIEEVLRQTFPDHGMLTEEGGETEGQGDARWIVDPLDGTTNYAHGVPFFCTSIALERAGEVVLGVVYDPMANEIYAAERGVVPPSTVIPRGSRVPTHRRVRSWGRALPTAPRSWRWASTCSED